MNLKSALFLSILGTVFMIGCGENTQDKMESQTDSLTTKVERGMDNLGDKIDTMASRWKRRNTGDADKDFLADAVEANTMELRALMLGQQNGGKDVKMHAGHMIADHKKLGKQVEDYMKKKNIVLSDVDTTDRDDDLDGKAAGVEFDKAWTDKMVDDHEHVIDMFTDAQDDVKDPELKTMITNALPKLKSHLEMAKQEKEKLDNAH